MHRQCFNIKEINDKLNSYKKYIFRNLQAKNELYLDSFVTHKFAIFTHKVMMSIKWIEENEFTPNISRLKTSYTHMSFSSK